jgi:L-fuconolactonase
MCFRDEVVETVLEIFGPKRVMFGSHRPISGLATRFETLYTAYETVAIGLSESEKDAVFRLNAVEWFRLSPR